MPREHGGNFGTFYNDGDTGDTMFLSYMAKTVTLPGKSLGTIDAKRFGPIYKVANDLIIDTVSMTFNCSADYKEHKFFEGWIAGIMGAVQTGTGSTVGGIRQLYTLSYYYDYVGQVNIIPLDRQGGAAAQVTLMEAYPTNVGPIEFAWGDTGEIANFTVTWSFKDWNYTDTDGWWADTDRDGSEFRSNKYREQPKGADYPGLGYVPHKTKEPPGQDGSRPDKFPDTVYKQQFADGTVISTVPHKTKEAPGKEGSGQYE